MPVDRASDEDLARYRELIAGWAHQERAANPLIAAVDADAPLSAVGRPELDRIVGSAYAYSERFFRPAMSIGYASKFGR